MDHWLGPKYLQASPVPTLAKSQPLWFSSNCRAGACVGAGRSWELHKAGLRKPFAQDISQMLVRLCHSPAAPGCTPVFFPHRVIKVTAAHSHQLALPGSGASECRRHGIAHSSCHVEPPATVGSSEPRTHQHHHWHTYHQ